LAAGIDSADMLASRYFDVSLKSNVLFSGVTLASRVEFWLYLAGINSGTIASITTSPTKTKPFWLAG